MALPGLQLPGISPISTAAAAAIVTIGPSLITNREFIINQRSENDVVSDSIATSWISDQFYAATTAGMANCYTATRVTNNPPSGFSAFLRLTFPGTAPAADQGVALLQDIPSHPELCFGTSNAVPLWVSAIMRPSIDCGITFVWQPFSSGSVFSHLIELKANVWNTIAFPIPGNVSDNINLGGGSTISFTFSSRGQAVIASPDAWSVASGFILFCSGQTDMTTRGGATLDIAGFDLRPATGSYTFVHSSFDEHLRDCGVFFQKTYIVGSPSNGWTGNKPGTPNGRVNVIFSPFDPVAGAMAGALITLSPPMFGLPAIVTYDSLGTAGVVDYHNGAWNTGGAVAFTWNTTRTATIDPRIVADQIAFQATFEYNF